MEVLKKTILQAVTTGTTFTGGTIIIPDLTAVYYVKIGLKQAAHDFGFFDAYVEEIIPPSPTETYYLVDDDSIELVDDDENNLIY